MYPGSKDLVSSNFTMDQWRLMLKSRRQRLCGCWWYLLVVHGLLSSSFLFHSFFITSCAKPGFWCWRRSGCGVHITPIFQYSCLEVKNHFFRDLIPSSWHVQLQEFLGMVQQRAQPESRAISHRWGTAHRIGLVSAERWESSFPSFLKCTSFENIQRWW